MYLTKNNPFHSAQSALPEGKKCSTITAFSYINGKNFCVRNENGSLWSLSCFDYEIQQWWRIFCWEEITRFSMIKRLLEVGIHCNRVWLLIKHIFLCIPVYTGTALEKNFNSLFFSLGEIFPDAHVDLETMSELKFDANVTKQTHVFKWGKVKGNIISTTLFSSFIHSLLHLAAETKGKESKMENRNGILFKQQKVETVQNQDKSEWNARFIVFCRVPKDISFPQTLTIGILETNI